MDECDFYKYALKTKKTTIWISKLGTKKLGMCGNTRILHTVYNTLLKTTWLFTESAGENRAVVHDVWKQRCQNQRQLSISPDQDEWFLRLSSTIKQIWAFKLSNLSHMRLDNHFWMDRNWIVTLQWAHGILRSEKKEKTTLMLISSIQEHWYWRIGYS